jgi:site-specific DNA-methyltransferase (adenine-specific)
LEAFIPLAFRVLRDKGFCILFCDAMHFSWLHTHATSAGFTVCRWPLVWGKPTAGNQAAGYNFTKATEFAIVLRKGNATLVEHQPLNYRVLPNDKGDFDHPFAKPQALWHWLITAVSVPGQVILDPFAGSGSCPSACITAGRQWRAIELVPTHFTELLTHTAKRLAAAFPGKKLQFHHEPITPFLSE